MPFSHESVVLAVAANIMSCAAQVWAIFGTDGGRSSILYGFYVSQIVHSSVSRERLLTMVSMFTVVPLSESEERIVYNAVEQFARQNGCQAITAIMRNIQDTPRTRLKVWFDDITLECTRRL